MLKILLRNNPTSTAAVGINSRTPLHFALGNADRPLSAVVVEIIYEKDRDIIDIIDNDGFFPLHLLAFKAKNIGLGDEDEIRRVRCEACHKVSWLVLERQSSSRF